MKFILLFLVIFLSFRFLEATETPIIGVLALEPFAIEKYYPNLHIGSYIAASYVKFLESAGARVIPVWIGQRKQYYERVVKYTNGMLFPGGATYFNETKGYAEAAKIIYDLAVEANDMGVHYPIMGICLGMQVLVFASAGGSDIRVGCSAVKVSFPLEFENNFETSRIFKELPKDLQLDMQNKNVTYNYHKYCLTEDSIETNNLKDAWRIVAQNDDISGKKFISVMEHQKYPFYGLQFHPEKIKYEFHDNLRIPHDIFSGRVSQYFADFAVNECRNNNNTFPDKDIEHDSLIYNFTPVFGAINCSYFQLYLFTENEPINHQLT